MKFEIINVEHGFAAYATALDGRVLMFDCGSSSIMQPSKHLWDQGIREISRFFVMNYDEDHILGLPKMRESFGIRVLTRNASVSSDQLRSIKTSPISKAMSELLDMIDSYTSAIDEEQVKLPGTSIRMFCNSYPRFKDTNNLSLLVFLDIGDDTFALPGDLERDGWLELLKNKAVCKLLSNVTVFVASHHGRESGYCGEVFNYCKPNLVVILDGPIKYDTQEMASRYGQHATGGIFNGSHGQEQRKVISTRNDGSIVWQYSR